MKVVGIILICIQVIGIFAGLINGSCQTLTTNLSTGNPAVFANLIGYFIFGIIGVILLCIAYAKSKK